MKKLHQCKSCGYLSTAGSEFSRIRAESGCKITVCDECAESYGHNSDVTLWVNQAGDRFALESAQQAVAAKYKVCA